MLSKTLVQFIGPPIIFIGVVVLAFTIAIVMFGQNRYLDEADNLRDASKGDQTFMSTQVIDFSTFWCRGYEVTPWDYGSVYLLRKMPDIATKRDVTVIQISRSMMAENSYDERGAFLFKDSQISVKACREVHTSVAAEVMIIKGHSSWSKWRDNHDCATVVKYINLDILCNREGKRNVLNFTVLEDDVYHIAIRREREEDLDKPVYLSYDIILNRTIYDISNPIKNCSNLISEKCVLKLKHNSEEQVVVVFKEDNSLDGHVRYVHECKADLVVWFGIFGVVPLSLIVIVLIYIYVVVIRYNKQRTHPTERKNGCE